MVHIVESISGPPGWVNKLSTSFSQSKQWFQGIFAQQVFRKGFKVFVAFWSFCQKQDFQKGDGSHPLFQIFVVVLVGGC